MTPEGEVEKHRILLVEDNPGDVDLVQEYLADVEDSIGELTVAGTLEEASELLDGQGFDAVLLDLNLPDARGLEGLDAILESPVAPPVIVLTGMSGEDAWIESVRRGAADFLPKDEITGSLLARSVRYAVERHRRTRAERRFRALIENSRDLLAILDAEFQVRYVSPAVHEMIGLPAAELIGTDSMTPVHPADRDRVLREGQRVVEDPDYTARLQYRVRHRDGGWRVFDSVLQNHLDDPSIGGLILNSWDVTDIRDTELELESALEWIEVMESVAATANEASRLEDALEILAVDLPERVGWEVGRGYLVENGELNMVGASDSPGEEDRPDGAEVPGPEGGRVEDSRSPGAGLARAALESGTIQSRSGDALVDPLLMADGLGEMRSALAIPVKAESDVVGVLELFTVRQGATDDSFLSLAEHVRAQLGQVADRDRAMRRVRESRNLLEELVEGVPDAMYLKDREGRYVLINEAGARLAGGSRKDVIGRTDREIFLPDSARAVMANDQRVVEHGEVVHQEEETTDMRGNTRTYLVTKGPVRDSAGRITGLFGISRDITELTRAQKALEERVKELRTLFGASRVLARTHNPLAERLEELVELLPPGWLHPEVTEARIRYGEEVFETAGFQPSTWSLSKAIETDSGAVGRIEVVITEERPDADLGPFLREEEQLLEGLTLLIGEAINRARLEKEFIRAQKMEAVGRLSGGIAHDFNNLLTVIRAHADFLLMDLSESDSKAEEVRAIRDASDQAADLTAQLLAFGREQMLRPRVIDVNEAVESIRRLITRIIGEDVRVELDLEDDLPAIEVDPTQLEQSLLNLAVNARDAMPEGGTLTLATHFEEVGPEDAQGVVDLTPGSFVRITASDTGVGMDEKTRARIFEPFFSTKERGKGTGLGLAMVYGIVTQSGGAIEVISEPGEGAEFVLRFPVVEREPDETVEETPPVEEDREIGGRILLVEDDSSVRRVGRAILERAGFEVAPFPDAEAALEALAGRDPGYDVVLSDLVLPGMKGREFLDLVRQRVPGLPLVAMSGYAEGSPGRRGDLPSEIHFVQKPFTAEHLVATVRKALMQKSD